MSDTEFQLRQRITELEKEVESLRHIKKDYREIVEHATEIIFKLDASGSFYFVSAEFGRVLGYTNEQWWENISQVSFIPTIFSYALKHSKCSRNSEKRMTTFAFAYNIRMASTDG